MLGEMGFLRLAAIPNLHWKLAESFLQQDDTAREYPPSIDSHSFGRLVHPHAQRLLRILPNYGVVVR